MEPEPVVRLSTLAGALAGATLRGDAPVRGLTHDSRRVRPGWLFVVSRGGRTDGRCYAHAAVEAGAAGLVVEQFLELPVAQLRVPSVRAAIGPLAAEFHGRPSRAVAVAGVTGTNGKTTTCTLLRACFEAAGWTAGQIGTIETRIGPVVEPSELTTPQAPDLQATLARMVQAGVRAVALEVSSHALDQDRCGGTYFETAVFTNLTAEHLDYHGTVEQYWASKARLFEPDLCRRALVCVDDAWGRRLAAQVRVPTVTFGSTVDAQVRVSARADGLAGTTVWVEGTGGAVELRTQMVGAVNAANVAAAYLAALSLGVEPERARAGIAGCPRPPGRFELVEAGQPFLVVVDYAHTPDALAALLALGRSLVRGAGRVHLVVGARGGRDRLKRPVIGAVAARADRVVLTADSPGDEAPLAIIEQVRLGAPEASRASFVVDPDRRSAITQAVRAAGRGDVVLIVGRGHETVHHVAGRAIALDDRGVAREALRDLCWDDGRVRPPGASGPRSVDQR